jgi:catechol 2,3-dioxygenase-like lactoylglutathione lyase family enzyme
MDLLSLDHVHFAVPDLARAQVLFGQFLGGSFTPVYGGPELNAWGTWNTSGGDFIQVIRSGERVFGGAPIAKQGILSVSFRVADIEVGIAQAEAAGLRLRSRIGSEEVGFGRNVVQAQFAAEESFGLGLELVERQIPGDPHLPLTQTVVDHIEHYVADLDAPATFLGALFGSAFDPPVTDAALDARSLRHPRFGIQLTAPAHPRGVVAERIAALGVGTHAIAFQSRDLERDIATAESLGLKLGRRRSLGPGAREAEFEPEAGVIVKLVLRTRAA